MISANILIFILGGLSFLFVFSWFKKAAIAVFEKELASSDNQKLGLNSFKYFWLIGLCAY